MKCTFSERKNNWNIAESGVKHHKPTNQPTNREIITKTSKHRNKIVLLRSMQRGQQSIYRNFVIRCSQRCSLNNVKCAIQHVRSELKLKKTCVCVYIYICKFRMGTELQCANILRQLFPPESDDIIKQCCRIYGGCESQASL
jgi:hypothetical protein